MFEYFGSGVININGICAANPDIPFRILIKCTRQYGVNGGAVVWILIEPLEIIAVVFDQSVLGGQPDIRVVVGHYVRDDIPIEIAVMRQVIRVQLGNHRIV